MAPNNLSSTFDRKAFSLGGFKDDMNKLALFLVLGFGRALVLKASTGILLTSGVCCVCFQHYCCFIVLMKTGF